MTRGNLHLPSRRHLLVLGDPRNVTVHDPGAMSDDRLDIDAARPTAVRGICHILVGGDDGG